MALTESVLQGNIIQTIHMYFLSIYSTLSHFLPHLAFPDFQNVSGVVFGLSTVGSEGLSLGRDWALSVTIPYLELPVCTKEKKAEGIRERDICLGLDPR